MTTRPNGIGQALSQSLHLSSDETHKREKGQEATRTAYRRKYWQGYVKKVKRIFGTVTPAEYAAVKERADGAGRSVWGQVWAEAQAYHLGRELASGEIADQQRQLIAELRRIGNNLNQLACLGHIQNSEHGGIKPSGDTIAAEAMQQLAKLEAAVTKFDDGVTMESSKQTTADDGPIFPSDDILEQEAIRLMYAMWDYGPLGMSRRSLMKPAKQIRTGEIATCPDFMYGVNQKRRWKNRQLFPCR